MSIVLVRGGDASFDVDVLGDQVPGWKGLKVEARDNQELRLSPGERVELQADDEAIAGAYEVSFSLAPAAPRGWRAYLEPASTSGSSANGSVRSSEGDNRTKQYAITVEGAGGASVRRSMRTYTVPYARLTAEVQRLTRSGARIVSVEETTAY